MNIHQWKLFVQMAIIVVVLINQMKMYVEMKQNIRKS